MTDERIGDGKEYVDSGFWEKLVTYALAAGREVVELALQLYYATQSPDCPAWAKAVAYSALGYFIVPADAIPDIIPAVGYADDLGVLAAALAALAMCITPVVKKQARDKMADWFGE